MVKLKLKKLSKKNSQRIKTYVLVTGLLICCCIVFGLLFLINNIDKSTFTIESRVKAIAKEQKKEKNLEYGTIAWLRVSGTNIDTPVISYDKITALDNVDKIDYVWNSNNQEKIFNQVAISGHNILNLSSKPLIGKEYFSRFDDLMAFVYEDFVAENKYIQYTVGGEDYVYKIFGVFFDRTYNIDLITEKDYTEEEMKIYLEQIKELNIYDFDIDVDETDKLITLTTCTRMFGQFDKRQLVVVGRQLRENEKMNNYESKANKNYEEIRKIVEGDETNAKS